MPTLEGGLVAKWRESQGLTQEELGERCPEPKGRTHIKNIEIGQNSMRIATLKNLIRGLGVPGRDDAARLARFFQGPERQDAEDAMGRAMEDLQAAIGPRARRKAR